MSYSNGYKRLREIALHGPSTRVRLLALEAMVASEHPPSGRLLDQLLADKNLPGKVVLWIANYRNSNWAGSTEEETYRRVKLRAELEKTKL